jgi:predicted MFS family arabinose efflux permease
MKLPGPLQSRWWIVFASAMGLTVGTSSVLFNSFAVFVKPITREFGWSRSEFSFALTLVGLVTVMASPLFGALLDRYRIKRVTLPVIAVLSCAIAAMSLMGPALAVMYAIYVVCALAGPAQAPLTYSKAISLWFDRRFGLALGLATAGLGLGTLLIPLEGQYLIDHFGWRKAYLGLALTNFVVAFTAVGVFIREPETQRSKTTPTAPLAGVSLGTAVRSWRFWALTAAFTLGGVANGSLVHVVAMLTDRGMSPGSAAAVLASSGAAIIAGRLLGGYLLDLSASALFPSLLLLLPGLGSALLAMGTGSVAPVVAVMLCGLGAGVEIDMMGFFVRRYFGLRSFARIFGAMFPGFGLGVGFGPLFMGRSYDLTHSYKTALLGNAAAMAVATALLAGLGAYLFRQQHPTTSHSLEDMADADSGSRVADLRR